MRLRHGWRNTLDNQHEGRGSIIYSWTPQVPYSCEYLAPKIIELLRSLAVERVLDVGCGNGSLSSVLYAGGWQAVGMGPDEAGASIACASNPSVRFHAFGVHSDRAELRPLESLLDAVASTEVVGPLLAPRQLPAYAAAVLKPVGLLIISTSYHDYLKNLGLSIFGKWDHHHTSWWEGGHIKFWSRDSLTELVAANGFDVIDFRDVGRLPWLWKSMVLGASKK